MHKPAIDQAKARIHDWLDAQRPRAYRRATLRSLFAHMRTEWGLPQDLAFARFTQCLKDWGYLQEAALVSEEGTHRPIPRFLWNGCTSLEIASTLKEGAYLSHSTAMFLHGLTDQVPRTLYINKEQTPKPPPKGELYQANLDRAFRSHQRTSNSRYTFDEDRFILLSGKHTQNFGVVEFVGPSGESLLATGLERTLVDIAVRPVYSGGVPEVLAAYRAAKDLASAGTILATLRILDHLYPYHQAIGFYMQRAGFKPSQWKRLQDLGLHHDFYLTHAMGETDFDSTWRIHVPKEF